MRFAHADMEIAKRGDKQACLPVFPSPYPFIACAIPAPPGFMSELTGLMLLGMPVAMLPRLRLWTQSLPELPQAILIHFHSATLDSLPFSSKSCRSHRKKLPLYACSLKIPAKWGSQQRQRLARQGVEKRKKKSPYSFAFKAPSVILSERLRRSVWVCG